MNEEQRREYIEYLKAQGRTEADATAFVDRMIERGWDLPPVPRQEPESTGVDPMRKAGLALRAGIRGVTALPELAADAGAFAWNQTAGRLGAPKVDGFGRHMDWALNSIGLPEPETSGERIASDVISGVTGAAGPGLLARGVGGVGRGVLRGVERNVGTQALAGGVGTGAGSYVAEESDSPWLGLLAGLGATAGTFGAARGVSALRGSVDDRFADAARQIEESAGLGVRLRPGDVMERGSLTRRAESLLDRVPGYTRNRNEVQAQQVTRMLDDVSSTMRPAGLGPMDDVDTFITQQVRDRFDENKKAVGQLFEEAAAQAGDERIPMSSLVEMANEIKDDFGSLATLLPERGSAAQTLRRVLNFGGDLSYRQARDLQTQLGRLTRSKSVEPSVIKRLYGAISTDMDRWAQGAGEAGEFHRRAVDNWRELVVPFTSEQNPYRNMVTRSGIAFRQAIDDAPEMVADGRDVINVSNARQSEWLTRVLPEDARGAVPYKLWEQELRRTRAGEGTETFLRNTRLGDELGSVNTPFRAAVEGTEYEPLVAAARRTRDVSERAIRNSGELEPTGQRNLSAIMKMGPTVTGTSLGYSLGGPMGAAAGSVLGPAAHSLAKGILARGLDSDTYRAWTFANRAQPFSAYAQNYGLLSRR